jgi:hypothetical protein
MINGMGQTHVVIEEGQPVQPKWGSVKAATQYSGIPRYRIFELVAEGQIRSAVLKRRGQLRGRRLIDLKSLDDFIARHASGGGEASK